MGALADRLGTAGADRPHVPRLASRARLALAASPPDRSSAPGLVPPRPRDLPASDVGPRALLDLLLAFDVADLPETDVLGVVAGWQQLIGMATAAQAAVVSELVARRPRTPSRPVDDLACRLSTTSYAASALVSRADGLATHPVLADGLRSGVLDQRKVDVLLDEMARLPRDDADDVLRAAVADADGLTAPLLRRTTRRLVSAVDPDAAAKRAQKSRAERCVRLDWASDSMAWVAALLPAAEAVAVFSVVDLLADVAAAAQDDRTLAQRRADAFSGIFETILATGGTPDGTRVPTRQGRAAGVHLTLAASTLAGHDDLPGELAGYGPIPAPIARDLAAGADRYRPALMDEDGHLLGLGTHAIPFRDRPAPTRSPGAPPAASPLRPPPPSTGYRPGAELRRFVVARDESCMFPGCRRPADGCDLDHVEPFDGERSAVEQTIAANLQPLCRHHHRSKTHHDWHMHRDRVTGDVHTTSPDGITYVRLATTVLLTRGAFERALPRAAHGALPALSNPSKGADPPPPF
ncbi:HNH endonuclease signature motif containing protein [Cellulomonas alba]|uniref:DUF222 domain-containing protein n=1 Tax=Cellulomonas alba TaxID=3053467 RepID=A0ABT7SG70_9CELL|nr:HNH endonuclease signature motif containing protein [Cellulomonas alba]MDM7855176.1 DUF222 domain-containing protein [Cellulomonas alba]